MGYSYIGINLFHIIGKQNTNWVDLGYFVILDGSRLFVQCQEM